MTDYLNSIIKELKPSATLAVKTRAGELRAEGKTIIDMSAGEPDIDTPDHVKDAAKKALDNGKTKYTPVPGIPELRQALADKFTNENKIPTTADKVIVTNGGKQGLHEVFQVCLEPGDEVVIPSPYWVSYPSMVKIANGVPVVVNTSHQNSYKLTPEDLERVLSEKTKFI
ncbi:UNVERIFIED_CONTAM: hypothetical protein GTU68_041780, partial [Idotea baltica]|nr:hypothetical protein [Idotea baltica]